MRSAGRIPADTSAPEETRCTARELSSEISREDHSRARSVDLDKVVCRVEPASSNVSRVPRGEPVAERIWTLAPFHARRVYQRDFFLRHRDRPVTPGRREVPSVARNCIATAALAPRLKAKNRRRVPRCLYTTQRNDLAADDFATKSARLRNDRCSWATNAVVSRCAPSPLPGLRLTIQRDDDNRFADVSLISTGRDEREEEKGLQKKKKRKDSVAESS